MKKLVIILLAMVFAINLGMAQAASPTSQKNSITIDPLSLIFGSLNLQYTLKLSDANALALRGSFWTWGAGDFKATAIGFGGAYHFFFKPTALNSFYAGPLANILFWSAKNKWTTLDASWNLVTKEEKATSVFFSIGGEIGHRWVFNSGFTIDPMIQLYYMIGKLKIGSTELGVSGIGFGLGLGIGYSF